MSGTDVYFVSGQISKTTEAGKRKQIVGPARKQQEAAAQQTEDWARSELGRKSELLLLLPELQLPGQLGSEQVQVIV